MNSVIKFLRISAAGIVGLTLAGQLAAQSFSNSPYSIFGLGTFNYRASMLNRSMGGTGVAVQDHENLNLVNPASYVHIASPISHVYELGMNVETNRNSTTESSVIKTTGGLNNLIYWFKFKPWWASTLGLSPYTTTSYSILTTRETATAKVDYLFTGSGNINQLYWGNSFLLAKNLSVGFHASYLFGSISKSETMELTNQSSSLTLDNKIVVRKFNMDAGLQYSIPISEKTKLVAGFVADNKMTINSTIKQTLTNANADTLQQITGDKKTYTIPAAYGFGVAYHTPRAVFAADVRTENWSSSTLSEDNISLVDTWKFSAGYTYRGNPNALHYLGLVSMRAGFYAQNSNLVIKGTNLTGWGLSAGLSFPMFDGKSSLNLTYQFDKFGTTDNNLILQQSQKIMFDVVIRDLWGIKRKFD